jgi:hypothetical protein
MAKFGWFRRQLRRVPCLRKLGLMHIQSVRAKQREAQWRYTQTVLIGVGNLIGTWCGIERQLNTLICQYHPFATEKVRRKPLPDNLTAKIDYLVSISQDTRLPDGFRQKVADWVPRLGRLRNHRHLIVHGMIFQRNRSSTDWFAHRLTMQDGNPKIEEIQLSQDGLNQKQREIGDLQHDMAVTLNPLFFGPDWQSGRYS